MNAQRRGSDFRILAALNAPSALTLGKYRSTLGRMVLPDVCCDLVWARERLTLAGPMSRARLSANGGQDVILLRLDPLVARHWLKTPLHHLTDKVVPLADIDRRLADDVEAYREEGILNRLVRPAAHHVAVAMDARAAAAATLLRGGASVARSASHVGLSERQVERLFFDNFGLPPKTFAQILRFRRSVDAAKKGASLAGAAAAGGYADQAHFSREVRTLTGQSPRALLPNVGNVQDIVAGAI